MDEAQLLTNAFTWAYKLLLAFIMLTGVSLFTSFIFLWGIMKEMRGADRLCWMIAVMIPIFGPVAFIALHQKERENEWLAKHSQKVG